MLDAMMDIYRTRDSENRNDMLFCADFEKVLLKAKHFIGKYSVIRNNENLSDLAVWF